MRTRVVLLCALLFACNDKNIGPLLADKPGKPIPPMPGICETGEELDPLSCGVGVCAVTVPACVETVPNVCRPLEPRSELCNDLDDDCNGIVDDGCDDDLDGYCDAAMTVIDSPAVCPQDGLDCDDENEQRHPGRTEICDDEIDNDCNDLADYLDFNGCTHITASFQDGDGTIYIPHGTTRVITAVLTPPTLELERQWTVTAATPDDVCSPEQIELADPEETDSTTRRQVRVEDDAALLSCAYELTLHIGGIEADRITVRMTNARPRVDAVVGAVLDGGILALTAATGTNPRLTAVVPPDDDAPVVIEWAGRDAAMLNCPDPCEGPEMQFDGAPPAGTYVFTLRSRDSFDSRVRTRNLRVQVRGCVWLRANGTGTGTGSALSRAYGDIYTAVTAARTRGRDVCIAGPGTFDLPMGLVVPNGVGINAAFSTGGQPVDAGNTLRLGPNTKLEFASGYNGQIRRVTIEGQSAGTLVEAVDASPHFHGVEFVLPAGNGSRGLRVASSVTDASVRVLSSMVRSVGAQRDATGIEVVGGLGQASLVWNGDSTVLLTNCRGTCRGISAIGAADLELTGESVEVEAYTSGARALAIDVAGTAQNRATAQIVGLSRITARTRAGNAGADTVAIRLQHTDGTSIRDNIHLGNATQVAGRRLSAGIADGIVFRDGTFVAGASRDLTITNNRRINAGRAQYAWVNGCSQQMPIEGTDVSAGILLVGTTTATIERNGSNSNRDTSVSGGASSAMWIDGQRVVPPSVPGVWTVDTRDVRVVRNEIRSGVLSTPDGCEPPVRPYVEAFRDGLGPNAQASAPSVRLLLESNGLGTGRRGSFDAVPNLDHVGARVVTLSGATTARLENNYVAATRGVDLVGLYLDRVRDVALWNNVIEVEALGTTMNVDKRAVIIDESDAGALTLVNNIIVVREDGAAAADPTAIVERSGGAIRAIGRIDNNILFVESAERGGGGTYVRIEDGPRYTRGNFDEFALRVQGRENLLLPPLFRAHRPEHRRSITRLSERSPARDAGRIEGAPAKDRFENDRPIGAGIDIGHHEFR